jgi:hypothetical protein
MLKTPLHTVSNSPPTGSWFNVVDPATVAFCTRLITDATASSTIDRGAKGSTYLENIVFNRTTLWLWIDPVHLYPMTVAFHAADGPPYGSGRYYVCAGVDESISDDDATNLWLAAIMRFASINGVTTDNIYLWADSKEGEPNNKDRIFNIFTKVASFAGAAINEPYPNTGMSLASDNSRWPTSLYTRQFKNPIR